MFSILKWHFASAEQDDRGINESRGYACEIVAWRFLTHLSEHELIDYLLHELPSLSRDAGSYQREPFVNDEEQLLPDEETAMRASLLRSGASSPEGSQAQSSNKNASKPDDDPMSSFVGLNALEIAAIADAKKFLSQRVVQKVVTDIWNGDIVFWESLSVHSKKEAKLYNKRYVSYAGIKIQ